MTTEISANIILDSISNDAPRITTLHLRYPRFIHAEIMTHRVFSRNARSSRAVPVKRMLEEIRTNPVIPLFWGKNQKGMQADEECNEDIRVDYGPENATGANDGHYVNRRIAREDAWLKARDAAVEWAERFADAGYHKQIVNRLLEPFMHIDVLVTATEWSNFFALRDHPAAEPHFELLAKRIKQALSDSRPEFLLHGQWHMPYIDDRDTERARVYLKTGRIARAEPEPWEINELLLKISAARCARISYAPFDGNASIEREVERYDLLVGSRPIHASPVEHQATPDIRNQHDCKWENPHLHGNFNGWLQNRKTISGECV